MFDYLRNLGKSDAEQRQETLHAYVDGELSAAERRDFERELNSDAALRAEVEQLQALQASLRNMPRRRVPRNFTLDPAAYGRPAPNRLGQAYPALRAATAVAAFVFVLALGLGLLGRAPAAPVPASAPELAMESLESVAEAPAAEATRVVTETVVVEAESMASDATAASDEALAFEAEPAADAAQPAEEAIAGGAPPSAAGTPAAEAREIPPTEMALEQAEAATGYPGAADETAQQALSSNMVPATQTAPVADDSAPKTPAFMVDPLQLAFLLSGSLFVLLLVLTLVAGRRR